MFDQKANSNISFWRETWTKNSKKTKPKKAAYVSSGHAGTISIALFPDSFLSTRGLRSVPAPFLLCPNHSAHANERTVEAE